MINRLAFSFATTLTLSTDAIAEVCDKERPLWDGKTATAFDEVIHLAASPIVWLIVAITVITALIGWRLLWAVTALLWLAVAAALLSEALLPNPSGIRDLAIAEGCIGPPHLAFASTGLLALITFTQVFNRRRVQRA